MMPNKPNTTGYGGLFQTSFFRNLQRNLPYKTEALEDTIKQLNPKYVEFRKAFMDREEALKRNSVTANQPQQNSLDATAAVFVSRANTFLNMGMDEQKVNRIKDWKTMASYAEVADALDEISNEMFNQDETGRVAELKTQNIELEEAELEELLSEFDRYISYYKFDTNGKRYAKQILVTAELFFEQIIHEDYISDGVLGVQPIPQELIEPVYFNMYTEQLESFVMKKPKFDPENPNMIIGFDIIPLQKNQVVYIHSGQWNAEKTCRIPHIEGARRAWRQLSLIEDSIIIYRLVRAPERLIFNVDVGNMSPPAAEAYINKLSKEYWSKKAIDPNTGEITQKYNPQSMLDNFWFAKRTGSEGSSVDQLAPGANLGELADLMYFAQKLYKSLRVPVSRLQSDNTYKDGTDILREELKFAEYIISVQQQFSESILRGFLTHLELIGLKDKLRIREDQVMIHFFPPTNFVDLREAKKMSTKMEVFNSMTQNPLQSVMYAQAKYLRMTPKDINTNQELLRKEKALLWELGQIEANGPKWAEIAVAQAQQQVTGGAPSGAEGGVLGGSAGGLGGGGGGGGQPLDLGPPPPPIGAPAGGLAANEEPKLAETKSESAGMEGDEGIPELA